MSKTKKDHSKHAIEVFKLEAISVSDLSKQLDKHEFNAAVDMMLEATGRVVVSGVGKSGIIGRKISATLASTGTPSVFLHPVEAFHGDLGMLRKGDVVIAISYSGETEELLKIIPFLNSHKIPVVAITGNIKSTLAQHAAAALN
ncbi:MAG: SIS domain-containing protein, partial [Flavobacteriales bacterium]